MQSAFLSRLLTSFVLDAQTAKLVSLRGRKFILPVAGSFINRQFLPGANGRTVFESKEGDTLDFIAANLRDGDAFWDIGANVGCYVAYANLCANLSATVALEPEALNYAELCKTVKLNGFQNVSALCCGAWNSDSFADFHLQAFTPGNHSGRTRDYQNGGGVGMSNRFISGYSQKVHLVRVDDLVRAAGIPQPNVLLMDIDGGEVGALQGMRETLRAPGLRAVVVEVDDKTLSDVEDILLADGFERVGAEKSAGRRNLFFCRPGHSGAV